jgi:hypothetical protein
MRKGSLKISAFSFLRNGSKLYYPILESIQSALPLVDEFVIAMGDSDADDSTREEIERLGSSKIVFIDTVWDLEAFPGGTEYAHQTDIAKDNCTGDWLLYLQGDEVIHEDDIEKIRSQCQRWAGEKHIDGMIFDYLHFWGDYDHIHKSHAWYKQEIRIIRNDPEIHSRNDAQSFRRIPNFDGVSYRKKEGTRKLHCVHSGAKIYHYGWVRPPNVMKKKQAHFEDWHENSSSEKSGVRDVSGGFDYGPLNHIPVFEGSHPVAMKARIDEIHWKDQLYSETPENHTPPQYRHGRFKYRFLSWLENTFFQGRHLFSSKHYILHSEKR